MHMGLTPTLFSIGVNVSLRQITEQQMWDTLHQAREALLRIKRCLALNRKLNKMDIFYMRADFGDICEARGFFVALLKQADIDEITKKPVNKTLNMIWEEVVAIHSDACDLTAKILDKAFPTK